MGDKTTYYSKNKEKVLKNTMKIIKKDCKNKELLSIDN